MNNILMLILIVLIFFGASCSSPARKDINKTLETKMQDKIDNIDSENISLSEIVIIQKINYFLAPLVLGLFAGVLLLVSGVRVIGLSILAASVTCIVLVIMLATYMKLIALIGLGVLLIGIYFLGKNTIEEYRIKRDLVKSVEVAKKLLPKDNKKILKERLDSLQKKYTKKIVSKIKEGSANAL